MIHLLNQIYIYYHINSITDKKIQNNHSLQFNQINHTQLRIQDSHDNIEEIALAHQNAQSHVSVGQFIKSAVYGGVDGIITTFNIALSGYGADAGVNVIVGVGVSSLLADGLAMGIADYIATTSEAQFMQQQKQRQRQEINKDFESEKTEMVNIYNQLGIQKQNSEQIVKILASNKQGFLDVMMIQELGLLSGQQSPIINSLVTFFAFGIFGLMPLLPYIVAKGSNIPLNNRNFVLVAGLLTAVFLFILGFSKSLIVLSKWYYSGIEAVIVGGLSAAVAYGIETAFGAQEV